MRALTRAIARVTGASVVALTLIAPAEAATITVDSTNLQSIPGLTGFTTDGSMMSGMTVSVYFASGSSETQIWETTGPGTGGVSGSGWSLSLTGDSFVSDWIFNSDAGLLTRLVLDGSTGLTVFDKSQPEPGTNGSASGRDFGSNLAGDALITATYSNPVRIGGSAAVGDLFQIVDVDFTGVGDGGVAGRFTFRQDTDNDLRLVPVPEPSTLVLFGIGLVGTIRARRRG